MVPSLTINPYREDCVKMTLILASSFVLAYTKEIDQHKHSCSLWTFIFRENECSKAQSPKNSWEVLGRMVGVGEDGRAEEYRAKDLLTVAKH